MEVTISQDDDKRLSFKWRVQVQGRSNMRRFVDFRLTYLKKNKRATVHSDVAGFTNRDSASGSCTKKVGNI